MLRYSGHISAYVSLNIIRFFFASTIRQIEQSIPALGFMALPVGFERIKNNI